MVVDRLRAVPAWAWLALLVLASFLIRAWLARSMVGPFIMVDELIYSELARSFAAGGEFLVRDVPTSGYSVVYPILISPAYALFERLPDAYAAVKTINSLLMSLAAVPVYLLARRVVRPSLALAAAALALALPSLHYTGTVMTENAFYPAFCALAYGVVRYLEQPGWRWLTAVGALLAVAMATRVQAVAVLPALAAAPLLLVVVRGRPYRPRLRPFLGLYASLAVGGIAVVALQAARGRSVADLVGAYSVVGDADYPLGELADYLLWHLAELDLYLGVLPVAATLFLLATVRRQPEALQAFLVAAACLSACLALTVAAFASQFAFRIQERNLFVIAPLFLIGLLAWVERGAPRRPRWLAVGAVGVAALLPATIPFARFVDTPAVSDTLALLPIWNANEHLPFGGSVEWTVAAGGLAAAALFLLVPRRAAAVTVAVTLVWLLGVSYSAWTGRRSFEWASTGAVFQGIRGVDRDWIDEAVGGDTPVAVLWTGRTDRFTVNQNEFFNRAVRDVYYVGAPTPGGFGEREAVIPERGPVLSGGEPIREPVMLLDGTFDPLGELLARDEGTGMTLWRLDGPLVASNLELTGLYPQDTWSGRVVTYRKEPCRPGTLVVTLGSDPALFTEPTTVVASQAGREVGRIELEPDVGRTDLRVPLRPEGDVCRLRFEVSPTAVPSQVVSGSVDDRRLGAHFYGFVVDR